MLSHHANGKHASQASHHGHHNARIRRPAGNRGGTAMLRLEHGHMPSAVLLAPGGRHAGVVRLLPEPLVLERLGIGLVLVGRGGGDERGVGGGRALTAVVAVQLLLLLVVVVLIVVVEVVVVVVVLGNIGCCYARRNRDNDVMMERGEW